MKPQKLRDFAKWYLPSDENHLQPSDKRIALTPEEVEMLPANKQKIGDIVIVSVPPELSGKKTEIAQLLLKMDSKTRLVLGDSGIEGQFRIPVREIIGQRNATSGLSAGCILSVSDSFSVTETVHSENRCRFKLDAAQIMFSKGNLEEKRRLSTLCAGETIVDMFAGIGYFSIPIAVHSKPEKIIAIELNPVSYHYLCENVRLNRVENIVEPVLGDCGRITPKGIADRVLMGYVGTTHYYLAAGISAIKKEGGILHYHETVPEKLYPNRSVQRIMDAAAECGRGATILETRMIKKYSPGVYHVVVDAKIE
ncbi:class I SAM-dependent methyltransferase family protein [Methanolapillus millepedarum]|uniref:tRNA(Phe) (4-demethylwyosine(37)-C(7)) aminocarboxypropyltransferase n=1 Tax=Methanolapillus millepedarum TaxID=3028296 RepID=A0AA96ZTQ1_9EURY|nr:hypothetical protein MsAc7_03870 [Methanosarcinaceae archaeon Ac7]